MVTLLLACSLLVWLPLSLARCGDSSQNCTALGCDVYDLNAICTGANLTCVPACIPNNTIVIKLSYNNIVDVTADSFQDFANIALIDLSYNNIATISADAFWNAPLLEVLNLDSNFLQSVPDGILDNCPILYSLSMVNVLTRPVINFNIISNNRELVIISISKSQLTNFADTTLMNLSKLEQLNLEDTMLSEIPPDAFRFNTQLRMIHLGRNNITTLPANLFAPLTLLSDLSLYDNHITVVPSDLFLSNHNLGSLDLGDNDITFLDDLLFQPLINLQTLYLYGNELTEVVPSFQYNPAMWILNLRNNSFVTLPTSPLSTNTRVLIWLEGNRWNCGCWTVDFLAFAESRNGTVGDDPICEEPAELAGIFWRNLTDILVC